MTLFDPIVEPGHLEFNKIMQGYYKAQAYSELVMTAENRRSKVKYYKKSLINHIRLSKQSKPGDVWLIFDTVTLFLLTWFKRFNGVQFMVHNNLDFAFNSPVLQYMYKVVASRCNLIYLEHRLAESATQIFKHRGVSVLQHPVIPVTGMYNPVNTVFVSSRNITADVLSRICEMESDKQIICNKVIEGVKKDNLTMGYIQDFDAMLLSCDKVYIIGYKLRSSGILYKALSISGMTLVFDDSDYYNEINGLVLQQNYKCKLELLN